MVYKLPMTNLVQHYYLPKPVDSVFHIMPGKFWCHLIKCRSPLSPSFSQSPKKGIEPPPAAPADTSNLESLGSAPVSMSSTQSTVIHIFLDRRP